MQKLNTSQIQLKLQLQFNSCNSNVQSPFFLLFSRQIIIRRECVKIFSAKIVATFELTTRAGCSDTSRDRVMSSGYLNSKAGQTIYNLYIRKHDTGPIFLATE